MTNETKKLALVAACCRNGGIGINGTLPWRLKSEMDFFSRVTSTVISPQNNDGDSNVKKNAVIMGTRTYLSIPPRFRPLKDRINVVLSRTITEPPGGVSYLFRSLSEAVENLSMMSDVDQLFVIGGADAYAEAIKRDDCEYVFLTRIDSDFECDRFFPDVDPAVYEDITEEPLLSKYRNIVVDRYQIPLGVQNENGISFRYHLYKRK